MIISRKLKKVSLTGTATTPIDPSGAWQALSETNAAADMFGRDRFARQKHHPHNKAQWCKPLHAAPRSLLPVLLKRSRCRCSSDGNHCNEEKYDI